MVTDVLASVGAVEERESKGGKKYYRVSIADRWLSYFPKAGEYVPAVGDCVEFVSKKSGQYDTIVSLKKVEVVAVPVEKKLGSLDARERSILSGMCLNAASRLLAGNGASVAFIKENPGRLFELARVLYDQALDCDFMRW